MLRLSVLFALLFAVAAPAHGISSQFQLILDLDGNPNTGCEFPTSAGVFQGAEAILVTHVETEGLDQATVVGVERRDCIDPVGNVFGPPQMISGGGWPVGIGNGDAGFNVVETFLPLLPGQGFADIRIGLVATDELGNSSVLVSTLSGDPIVVVGVPPLPVPMVGTIILLLLAVLLLGAGLLVISRRGRLTLTALVCLSAGSVAGAACVLDGQIFNWSLADRLAQSTATDPENGVDLRALYGKLTDGNSQLCFRIDTALVFATLPVAVNDDYVAIETGLLAIGPEDGLLANDQLAIPEAALVSFGGGDLGGSVDDHAAGATVAVGADGSLTIAADGSFSFQAATGFSGDFSFDYLIANVAGDSEATVVVQVQAIPIAEDDSYEVVDTDVLTVAEPGVLANDSGLPDPVVSSFGGGDLGGDVNDHAAGDSAVIAPDGSVTVNADGSLTFDPPSGVTGAFSFMYRIDNEAGSDVAEVTVTINQVPVISSDDAFTCEVGQPCDFNFEAGGFPAPVISLDGDLPDGVSFNTSNASLEGTPLPGSGAEWTVTIAAANGIEPDAEQSFVLTVNEVPAITSADSLGCQVGMDCDFVFTATGHPDPTFDLPGLPAGLSLDPATGVLSGQPAVDTGGEHVLTLTAENVVGDDDQTFTLTIGEAPTITSAASLTCEVGSACDFTFTADGFPAPTFDLPGLPASLSLDSVTGILSGTADALTGGIYNLTLSAENSVDEATQAFVLTINEVPAITSADSLGCQVGTDCDFVFTATGHPDPTFDLPGLPAGLSLDPATGVLSGQPAVDTGGEHVLTLTAENVVGDDDQTFTLTIGEAPTITSAASLTCEVGSACDFTFTADGFPAPTFELPGLPAELSLNATTGELSGTPDAATGEIYNLTLTAMNGITPDAMQAFTLTVNEAPTITSGDSLTCVVGSSCDFIFTADGFPGPSFGLPGLPSGLSLDSNTGVLSGTPDADTGAIYSLTLTAMNGITPDDTQAFTLTINEAPTLTSGDNLTCVVGSSCDFSFTADGFPAPNFGLPGLPSGLSLDSNTGVLSGTPNANTGAVYNLILTATNGVAPDDDQAFTLTINEAPTLTSADNLTCILNEPCSFTFTADGFPDPTFELPGLPSALSLNASTGELSGTPDTDGVYNLTLAATNTAGNDNQAFTLTIGSPPTITSADNVTCEVGSVCEFTFLADGTPAPTIDVTGTLPAGVVFDAASNTLEGTPDAGTGATYSLTVAASNGVAPDASQSFTLTVNEAPVANDDPEGSIPGNSSPGSMAYHGAFNTALNVSAAAGVLVNDDLGFPQASIVTISPIATAGGGTVTLNADGSFGYTPAAGFTGIDTFGYCIENAAAQDCATVEVAVGERPSADDHTFAQTLLGNTHVDTANSSNFSLLSLTGGDGISIAAATETNGQVSINTGTGTFNFNPAAGHTGAASFQYTVSNGFGSATGTVSLNVQGVVWYFDNSAAGGGDGRLASPFNSLAGAAVTAAGEVLFLHTGSSAYSGGITLQDNQVLVGHADADNLEFHAGQSAPDDSLLPVVAAEPLIVNAGGHGIALGSGNGIHGLHVGNTTGFGIFGNNFGTLAISGVSVTGTGSGLHLDTGMISGAGFGQVNATTGTHGILLTAVDGTVNLGGGSVSGATIAAMELNGGAANVNYAGSLTAGTGGRPALVQNKSAGTVALTGALSSTQLGVRLASNTGATVRFAGGMVLSTGGNMAFQATGGGTVEVCDENPCNPAATGTLVNTLTTTTATALEVTNTTIGSNRLEFRSISAGTVSTGPANGIVLNNTGTSGGLAVTGTGTAGSGGLLRNTTGSAIRATSSHNLTLAWMNIASPATTSPPPNLFSGGMELNNLTGNGRFTRLDISAYNTANTHGMTLVNNNANLAGLILEGVTVRDSTNGANAVLVVGRGSSNMTVTIQSHNATPSNFTSLVNSGVRVNTDEGHTGTMNFSLLDANFQGVSTAGLTQPVVIAPFSNSTFNFAINGNTINNSGTLGNNTGLINVAPGRLSAPGPTTTGSISNNSITNSTGFRAINITPDTFAGQIDLTIDNNSIQGVARQGMFIDFRDAAGAGFTNRLRIRGNQIGNISPTAGGTREAILVDVRGNAAKTVNTVIGGTGGQANTIVHNGDAFFEAIRVIAGRSGEGGAVVHNATVLNNSITENGAAVGFRAQGRDVGTLCLNMSGNGFSPANTELQVNQANSGTLNVTQTSQAALQSANPGSSVVATGTVLFGQPVCPMP